MLFQGSFYFPTLILLLVMYWRWIRSDRGRHVLFGALGVTLVAHLLSRRLPVEVAIPLLSVLIVSVGFSFALARRLARHRSIKLLLLALAVPMSTPLALLVSSSAYRAVSADVTQIIVPISIGFLVLRQVHFVYESYRGRIQQLDLLLYCSYVFFFATLVAGPLERYPRYVEQRELKFNWSHISAGSERILIGCFKKLVVADQLIAPMLPPAEYTLGADQGTPWIPFAIACFLKLLYVYADFSGYTDIAVGTARLFGVRIAENFNFPLLRANLAEFWRSWHMSLSSFARDYVYYPLLAKFRNTFVALIATMLAIAAWHGTSPGWLLWGLHHGLGLVLLSRFQRWVPMHASLRQMRATLAWRFAAIALTWLFLAGGHALTWHVNDASYSLRLYVKFWSFGTLP